MLIEDRFRVELPVAEAWELLLDIERIAPCLPGAQLQEVEGDEYRGVVKVKVGPITAQYKGTARIEQVDPDARRAVIAASGRDTRGQGNASAAISVQLRADGDATDVSIDTDLSITGKVAQFGRGVLADVSSKLLGQFVENLERDVLSAPGPVTAGAAVPEPPGAPVEATPERPGVRRIEGAEAEPVDLLGVGGSPLARRLVPVVGAVGGLMVLVVVLRRRRVRRRVRGRLPPSP